MGWLSERLTYAKQQIARWVDLAESIEAIWEEEVDPHVADSDNAKSIYTASDEVLLRRLRDLKDLCADDNLSGAEDKRIAIEWRRIAIEFKDTQLMIESTLLRKFWTTGVTWTPLYAPRDTPYGTEFVGQTQLSLVGKNIEDYFLTCHGSVDIGLSTLSTLGITIENFVTQVWDEMLRVRPAHIVFDGVKIFSEVDLPINFVSFVRDGDVIEIGVLDGGFPYTLPFTF